jgi:hypothetical protein
MADRISLSNDWHERGSQLWDEYENTQEPRVLFESYIYLWIALTVAARENCSRNTSLFEKQVDLDRSTDLDQILWWADINLKNQIMRMLKSNKEFLQDLCDREGFNTGNPIMDTCGESVLLFHNQFLRYWNGNSKFINEREIVETFIRILNRVRNNLFHGAKSFRVESDVEILELTCPLLKDLTKIYIKSLK